MRTGKHLEISPVEDFPSDPLLPFQTHYAGLGVPSTGTAFLLMEFYMVSTFAQVTSHRNERTLPHCKPTELIKETSLGWGPDVAYY